MTRVYITDDFATMGISIVIAREWNGDFNNPPRRDIMHYGPSGVIEWEMAEPGGIVQKPSLRMDEEVARALLDALTRHFHGSEDSRVLRKDYDDERKRVDRLTDAMMEIAAEARHLYEPRPPT